MAEYFSKRAAGYGDDEDTAWLHAYERKPPVATKAMFFGLPGALARTLDPQTEADPVATIFTFLVLFGCWIGHVPYFSLLADRHYCNEDVLLVGETGEKGRKGHSLGPIEYLLKQ